MQFLLRLTLIMAAMTGVASLARAESTLEALNTIQGTWVVRAGERGGKRSNAMKGARFVIGGDSFLFQPATGDSAKGKIVVRADISPHQIDFLLPSGELWQGIFSTTADSFRLTYVKAADRVERPKAFATTASSPSTLVLMRRGIMD